jgi:hypothetical protein
LEAVQNDPEVNCVCLFQQHDATSLPFGTEVSIARLVVSASMIVGGMMLLTLWK